MPKRIFRRMTIAPDVLKQQKGLGFLAHRLAVPALWHLNRRSVSGAFAVGLFMMWLPVPFQTVLAVIAAIAFRVNLPISVVLVFITNPVTMLPMYYGAYALAATVMGRDLISFQGSLSWEWWSTEFATIGLPLTLGVAFMAVFCSIVGFVGVRLFWIWHVRYRVHKRKQANLKKM